MEKKFDDLVLPNAKTTATSVILGFVVTFITCGVGFAICSGWFFDRKSWLNRKALYKYIKKNGVPSPTRFREWNTFVFGETEITFVDNYWYGFSKGQLSICSFRCDILDCLRYRKINAILRAAT